MDSEIFKRIVWDYSAYRDKFGLIQPTNDGRTSQNGLRFTAEYCLALTKHLDDIPYTEKHALQTTVNSCEVLPGLFRRSPVHHFDQEGPDDYVGLGVIAKYINPNIARRILRYGRSQKWLGIISKYNYNNVIPGKWTKSSWLGRQQQLICHWQYAAGENPPLWRRIWWVITVLLSLRGRRDDQDNWLLSWMLIRVGGEYGALERWVTLFWARRFKSLYPGGIGVVLGNYFQNHAHPSAKWLKYEYGET